MKRIWENHIACYLIPGGGRGGGIGEGAGKGEGRGRRGGIEGGKGSDKEMLDSSDSFRLKIKENLSVLSRRKSQLVPKDAAASDRQSGVQQPPEGIEVCNSLQ